MLLQSTRDTLCEYLNGYLMNNVWSQPNAEYRKNIRLKLLYDKPQQGTVQFRFKRAKMPEHGKLYYIYYIPMYTLGGFELNEEYHWCKMNDFLDRNKLILRIHYKNGEMFCRNKIYFSKDEYREGLYILLEEEMVKKIVGSSKVNPKDVFMAIYYDSDVPNDIKLSSYHLKTFEERREVFEKIKIADTVYLNGRESLIHDIEELSLGDYVETLIDDNIYCRFDLDLTTQKDSNYFMSERDKVRKLIVHIPKILNPDNKVLTHVTSDIFVRPKDVPDPQYKGLYLHRCQMGIDIDQITHNDFSIPDYILEDYKQALNTDALTLHIICRLHSCDNILIRNFEYIDLLYLHEDKKILDFLTTRYIPPHVPDLLFWSASSLERSEYVKMLKEVPIYKKDQNAVSKYIQALGYFHTGALICKKIQRKVIAENLSHRLYIGLPLLYTQNDLYMNIFIKGYKLHNSKYTLGVRIESKQEVLIDEDVYLPPGEDLVIELYDKPDKYCHVYKPTLEKYIYYIDNQDFVFYEQLESTEEIQGVDTKSKFIYKEIDYKKVATLEQQNNDWYFHFKEEALGRTFMVQNNQGLYLYNKNVVIPKFEDIKPEHKNPIIINAVTLCTDDMKPYPIMGNQLSTTVYINGNTLVQHVDYDLKPIKDKQGNVSFYQIIIQNVKWLKEGDNAIEAIITRELTKGINHGHLTKENIAQFGDSLLFFHNTSNVFIDGKVIKDVEIKADGLHVNLPVINGTLYGIRSTFGEKVIEFLNKYHLDNDTERVELLQKYFHKPPYDYKFIKIDMEHSIYSLFLAVIFRDVTEDKKHIVFEPDKSKILDQVKEYNYLKDLDIINNSKLDLRFIDIYPTFFKYLSKDNEMYRALKFIEFAYLPEDRILDPEADLIPARDFTN